MGLRTFTVTVEIEERRLSAYVANQITAELEDDTRTRQKTNARVQRECIRQSMDEVEDQFGRPQLSEKGVPKTRPVYPRFTVAYD